MILQLGILISYIIEEAEKCKSQEQACLKIESRLPLLLECLQDDHSIVNAITNLQNKSIESNFTVQTFVILLYMRIPKIWNILTTNGNSPLSSIMYQDTHETDCTGNILYQIVQLFRIYDILMNYIITNLCVIFQNHLQASSIKYLTVCSRH